VLGLREKTRALEGKLAELIQFGEENDVISEKVHRLAVAMLSERALHTVLHELYYNLREDFAIPHARLRLWRGMGDLPEFGAASDGLREYAAGLEAPFCGPNANFEAPAGSATRRRTSARSRSSRCASSTRPSACSRSQPRTPRASTPRWARCT
jgi:uncharacterized protein YigA (DUF484 family)